MNKQIKKRALHRAKIIQGQVTGLLKGITSEDYCIDLITQSLCIQKSLKSLEALILENHLKTHVKYQMAEKSQQNRAVSELLKIYDLSNRS
ncbi:MAG: hypothetical protein COU81_01710 [Candidatus Portnoybacteria bacterium CG10_big_fil_rev_8_21_14_0_10_36_7]|uniref:Transcriptional regulator n=1 Tax=Candidatus Portnoybacteria bacterium CG10_big_fil_rev_8_21_14_0_10_36_7 TaxID=1974812 RepID=A0A2M8KEA4_9BACT|nr:MAG: hypothetical protein COU81_01710 [Candidatus Portnoybacteria bacterium CG10_big_fil_rev_8_21_14_0_10_36_7]